MFFSLLEQVFRCLRLHNTVWVWRISLIGKGYFETQRSPPPPPTAALPSRFYGTVALDPTRVGRDADKIIEEVMAHISGLIGAKAL